jgi:hypothetical protein
MFIFGNSMFELIRPLFLFFLFTVFAVSCVSENECEYNRITTVFKENKPLFLSIIPADSLSIQEHDLPQGIDLNEYFQDLLTLEYEDLLEKHEITDEKEFLRSLALTAEMIESMKELDDKLKRSNGLIER